MKEDIQFANSVRDICRELGNTLIAKNADYGSSFDKSLQEFGDIVSVIRMQDKLNRLKSMCNGTHNVQTESMQDTLLDLAGYAILTLEYLERKEVPNGATIREKNNKA